MPWRTTVHSNKTQFNSSRTEQFEWDRVIAAIDGSVVDMKSETIEAGVVVGPQPDERISFPVGGRRSAQRLQAWIDFLTW